MTSLPKHLRMVRGTRLAVDRAAREAWRLGADGWAKVDLDQEDLVRRALPLLTARAWVPRPDTRGLVPPGVPPGARPAPEADGLWVTRRGSVYRYAKGADGVRYGSKARVRRAGGRLVVRLLGGRELPLAEVQRAAWPKGA